MVVRPLETNAVRVRWLLLSAAKAEHLSFWRRMLNEDKRHRADRLHFPVDRVAFTAAHALTRAMLSEVTGKPSTAWRFVEGKYGRPEVVRLVRPADSGSTLAIREAWSHAQLRTGAWEWT
jgi:phosphopantetheinyl transferase